jgi:microcystin-dependent protein
MSQGATTLPTVGSFTHLDEQGFINTAAAALRSKFSGGSAPSAAGSPDGFQDWMDTSVSGLATWKLYLAGTASWLSLLTIDLSTSAVTLAISSPQNWAAASGTHDAITASYDPPVTALIDGMVLFFRATAANLSSSSTTFAPNGLTAHPITKNGGQALWIGDIPGNLAEIAVRYNAANTRWELLSPPDVPVGGIVPYFGATLPPGYALPQGQNLSSATYPAAATVLGVTYGNPGGGNFTMPDLRGRFFFNLDAGGSGRITVAGGNIDGTVLGNAGGVQNRTIAQANLPNVSFAVSGVNLTNNAVTSTSNTTNTVAGGSTALLLAAVTNANASLSGLNFSTTSNVTVASQGSAASGGSGTALPTLPPSIGVNCMMRIA